MYYLFDSLAPPLLLLLLPSFAACFDSSVDGQWGWGGRGRLLRAVLLTLGVSRSKDGSSSGGYLSAENMIYLMIVNFVAVGGGG